MSTEIYYFSGTGNSLHVAKELQKRLTDAKLLPMVNLLNKNVIEVKSESAGFVFPVYLTTLPVQVRSFIRKLDLKSVKYLFAAATHEGSLCFADLTLNKILKKKGRSLDSYFLLKMAGNSPTGIKPGPGFKDWPDKISSEKVSNLEEGLKPEIDKMQKVIINKEKYPVNVSGKVINNFLEILISAVTEKSGAQLKFYSDSTCTGCKTCEKVCLSGRIKMSGEKPVWQNSIKCFYCFACFNYCPEQAILLKNYTDKKGRYHHPEVTAAEIAGQK
jgi:ferredoxin